MSKTHGYICKKCGGPAPVGIGYVDSTDGAAERSAAVSACECGRSRTARGSSRRVHE
jgi:hypothetical protein